MKKKFSWQSIGCVLACALVQPSIASAQAVTEGELQVATLEIIGHVPDDAFDSPPVADFSGRTFVIDVPVEEVSFESLSCRPHWTYSQRNGSLNVTMPYGVASTYTMLRGPGADLNGAANSAYHFRPFSCALPPTTESEGVNGFGARVTITHRKKLVIGFSAPADPEYLRWSQAVTPDEGRALSQSLVVRYSGSIESWGPGGSIGCVREHGKATFTSPTETDETLCVVKASNLRVDLIDTRTGQALPWEPSENDGKRRRRR
ncbi:MAG: hypothetical protein JKY97_00835 [Citromicrobium sp.]|nr:hypothetical protein [Citromicrobium sp.]